jgi:hypothetical protein
MTKKILGAILLFSFLVFGQVQAAGLVPCGGAGEPPCKLCHFFAMVNGIIQFVVMRIVPVAAVLMLAIGGIMFFFAGGSMGTLEKAKAIMSSAIVGMILIFVAFLLVGTVLKMIGLADWTKDFYQNWWDQGIFQIPGC